MFKKLLICFLCITALLSCKHTPNIQASEPITPPAHPRLNDFHRLDIVGPFAVTLHTGAAHPHIKLDGDPRDLAQVRWHQIDETVYIRIDKGYPKFGPIKADISSRYLSGLTYQGEGKITGTHLHAQVFDITLNNTQETTLEGRIGLRNIHLLGDSVLHVKGVQSSFMRATISGHASLELVGMANVASIEMKDSSWLSLYWVKSNHLRIRNSGKSFLQLAGLVQVLNLELRDNARFNGEHLRAVRSFVKTFDHARADISVIKSDHAVANDHSNIYYYALPVMKADFMGMDGSILDMRNFSSPFVKEPTPYNQ